MISEEDFLVVTYGVAKSIKTAHDLIKFRSLLTKIIFEAALNAELGEYFDYGKCEINNTNNSQNSYTRKNFQVEVD